MSKINFKIWSFSFYFVYYAGIAFFYPYLVLFYQSHQFSGAQIGLLTGISPLITLVSVPVWTWAADRTNRHRWFLSGALLSGVAALILFPFLNTFGQIMALIIGLNIFFSPVIPIADSAVMYMLGEQKEFYGRLRLGGTIGFGILASVAGVLVENFGLKMAFWGAAVLYFLGFLVSQKLKHGETNPTENPKKGQLTQLLKNPRWLLFLLVAFIGGFAFATLNTYMLPFFESMGASKTLMGIALSIGTVAEIPALLYIHHLLKRFKPDGLLLLALGATGLRLLGFAASSTPAIAIIVQLLNGFTFPVLTVAGVAFADANAPAGLRSSAQGLFSAAMMGIGTATGAFIGGLLFEQIGGHMLYLIVGSAVFIVLALVSIAWRKLPAETNLVVESNQ